MNPALNIEKKKQRKKSKIIIVYLLLCLLILTTVQSIEYKAQILSENNSTTDTIYQFVWSTPIVVSNESEFRSLRPYIAVDGSDNVHFVYQDLSDIESTGDVDDDIFHKMWNATSETWSQITILSESSNDTSKFVVMQADVLGNIHVAWVDSSPLLSSGSDSDVFYRFWNITTATWSTIELVSSLNTGNTYWLDIATYSDSVYAVWQDASDYAGDGADEDVLFSKRFVNGTWTILETVSIEGSATSYNPSVIVDTYENVHVSWAEATNYADSGLDMDIFYRYRNATTGIWSTTAIVSSGSNDKSDQVDMAVLNNSSIFFTWVDHSNMLGAGLDHDIFYRFRNGTTESWTDVTLLTTRSTGDSDVPCATIDNNETIHLVWFDTTDIDSAGVDQDIFYTTYNATSGIWENYSLISGNSNGDSWRPKIALDSKDRVHLVWQDKTINYAGSGSDIDILYSVGAYYYPSAHLTLLNQPLDTVYTTTSANYNLTWILSDINVTNPLYSITVDDVQVFESSWITDEPITYTLNDLSVGNYTVLFEASDGWGETIEDEVLVIVEASSNGWIAHLVNGLIGLSIAIGTVGGTILVAYIIGRFHNGKKSDSA